MYAQLVPYFLPYRYTRTTAALLTRESSFPGKQSSKKPIYDDYEPRLPDSSTPVPSPASETIPQEEKEPPKSPPSSSSSPSSPFSFSSSSHQQQSLQRGPTPTDRLAAQIGQARLFLYRQATRAEDAVNRAADRAFDLERTFTGTVASLAPPRESGERLLPGLAYVLVASMAGSIVSRNRSLALRAAAPLAFGVGAGWLALPVTMRNVSDLLWRFEQRVPAVADAHLAARDGVRQGWRFARVHAELGRDYVEEKVHTARNLVEDWVRQGK
ncbi:hypothetical protein DL766_002807 [Monosporascus sp. MC13-8B]|uniref:MICOS complex subunit n=1 Tax=Monosporascus cannonballus TaxID=155416 RepID=A0ABY0H0D3_9PEZI|nr:hypothetical protein DL762_007151 [Monosporascus cannonballus]RYO88172.1 hypothetical protein DL763_006077 [Monosporascus cannonballus]RYP34817.1 hypothetical protein DL766_002807 [Monosporascus sp. MC13-8B]